MIVPVPSPIVSQLLDLDCKIVLVHRLRSIQGYRAVIQDALDACCKISQDKIRLHTILCEALEKINKLQGL